MTHKALLAESLDLLRQCELREYELDQARQRLESKGGNSSSGSKSHALAHETLTLVRHYETLYQRYLCGLQIMNYVRHLLLATTDARSAAYAQRVAAFCVGKMTAYMDRAEQLPRKLDTILVPVHKVDELTKPGYVMVNVVYALDGAATPLTMSAATHTVTRALSRGTYMAVVKNTDDYSMAAPSVKVTLDVRPNDTATTAGNSPLHAECGALPCGMAWRRVFGVSSSADVTLRVRASGMRDAHVDVLLQQWCPANEAASVRNDGDNNNNNNKGMAGDDNNSNSNKHALTTTTTTTSNSNNNNNTSDMLDDLFAGATLPPLTDEDIAAMASFNDATPLPPQPQQRAAAQSPPAPAQAPKQAAAAMRPPPPPPTYATAATSSHDSDVNVPLPTITVNPAGATTQRRLRTVRDVLDAWSLDGVAATALPPATQRELQAMQALPLPRELDDE